MNQNTGQPQLATVNINELQQKCQTKKELHQFLSLNCKAFLPSIKSTNVYFYKDIMRGAKEVSH
jgi:hypothetical protein